MNARSRFQIEWQNVGQRKHDIRSAVPASEALARQRQGLRQSLEASGIPRVLVHVSPEEEILLLLEIGAELEHALMVEYLYAGYSCQTPDINRTILKLIAPQEMGHLITVQNLRLLLGGDTYLGRQDQSPQPDKDPYRFTLVPLSIDAVARFCVAEMPAEDSIPAAMQPLVDEIKQRADAATSENLNRIGALYAKIYWLLMPDDETVGPWSDFPKDLFIANPNERGRHVSAFKAGTETFQADSAEWQIGTDIYIDACVDRDSALTALHRLTSQGEGLNSEEDSHFEQFVRIYERMKAGNVQVHVVPPNPTTTARPGSTLLANPLAVALSNLCDTAYQALVIEILLTMTISKAGTESVLRADLVQESLTGMRSSIRYCANQLATKVPLDPAQPPGATARSGAVFAAPSCVRGDRKQLTAAYLQSLGDMANAIDALAAVPNIDAVTLARIPQFRSVLAGKQALHGRLAQP